jgi:dipeptidyl aminopeptidase/acylaminoacyl peptidase
MTLPSSNRKRLIAFAGAAMVFASAAIALGVADSASPPESGPKVESHVGHSNIWTVDVASKQLEQETNHQGEGAVEPSWSAQGEIAFSSMDCDECSSQLVQLDPAGSAQVKIDTPSVDHLFQPSWAPDGRKVAVVALGEGIYAVDSQGGAPKQLTSGVADEAPDWSPTGDWIAFHRQIRGTNYDLFAVDAATGKERRLTHDSKQQTNPSWSAEGRRIAFAEQQANGLWAIITMNSDGSGRKQVTDAGISAQEPSWSPDGRSIAFILQELDKATVAVIDAAGSASPKRLTDDKVFPSKPTWSPDGKRIAFSAMVVSEAPPTN